MRSRRMVVGAAAMVAAAGVTGGAVALDGRDGRTSAVARAEAPAARIAVGDGPCCLAVTGDEVWVMNQRDMTVQRIDTDEAGPPVEVRADGIVPAGSRLLLSDYQTGTLAVLDPESGRQTPVVGFSGAGNATYDGRHLWLGSASDGRLAQVDPVSGRVVGVHTIGGVPSYDAMTFADGMLWTTTWEGELLRVDIERRRVTGRFEPFPDNTDYVDVAVARDRLFVVSGGTPALVVLDARSGEELERRTLDITGGPGVATQTDGSIWLTRGPGVVDELDPRTGTPRATYRAPLEDGATYVGGAVATTPDSVWLTVWPEAESTGEVVRFDRVAD